MTVFQRLVGKGNEHLLLWWNAPHMSIELLEKSCVLLWVGYGVSKAHPSFSFSVCCL